MSQCDSEYRLPNASKDPGTTLKVVLNLYDDCAIEWARNEPYTSGDYVRPLSRTTGFAYECTTAGVSGPKEPVWPRVIASTVTDGSVTWTCRAADTNGLNPITDPSATADDGLTVSDVAVVEAYKIVASYEGGEDGSDYEVVFTFTLNSAIQVARQIVEVRKQ